MFLIGCYPFAFCASSPSQAEGREFESRFPLQDFKGLEESFPLPKSPSCRLVTEVQTPTKVAKDCRCILVLIISSEIGR